jgi:hypothetical protein
MLGPCTTEVVLFEMTVGPSGTSVSGLTVRALVPPPSPVHSAVADSMYERSGCKAMSDRKFEGSVEFINQDIEVWEGPDGVPRAAFAKAQDDMELFVEEAIEEHYGRKLLFGMWVPRAEAEELPWEGVSVDGENVVAAVIDGFAPPWGEE